MSSWQQKDDQPHRNLETQNQNTMTLKTIFSLLKSVVRCFHAPQKCWPGEAKLCYHHYHIPPAPHIAKIVKRRDISWRKPPSQPKKHLWSTISDLFSCSQEQELLLLQHYLSPTGSVLHIWTMNPPTLRIYPRRNDSAVTWSVRIATFFGSS
jgi:hypothetical protein